MGLMPLVLYEGMQLGSRCGRQRQQIIGSAMTGAERKAAGSRRQAHHCYAERSPTTSRSCLSIWKP
jgi:hypothetical protein